MDDINIGMMEVTADTVEVVPFLLQELATIGIDINARKMVVLPPKGHAPSPE